MDIFINKIKNKFHFLNNINFASIIIIKFRVVYYIEINWLYFLKFVFISFINLYLK